MISLSEFLGDETGQDLIEYALLAAFISLSVLASIEIVGASLNSTYNAFKGEIDGFSAS